MINRLTLSLLLLAGVTTTTAPLHAADDHKHGDHDDHAPATPDAHAGHDHDDHAKHNDPLPPAGDARHAPHDDHAKHGDEVRLSAAMMELHRVVVGKAERRSLNGQVVAPGRVAFDGDAVAHVGSAVSGRAVELKVRVGQPVAQGEVLLVIESPELGRAQSEWLQRRSDAALAEAAVAPTRAAHDRAKALFDKSQGIALSDVQKREMEYRAAVGAAASATALARAAENTLRLMSVAPADLARLADTGEIDPRYAVRAPIAGQVIERDVTPDELVSTDRARLLVIADTATAWVIADVPDGQLALIANGGKADVTVPAVSQQTISGAVLHIAPEIDPALRAARVRVVVPNAAGTLRPGMFATITLHGAGRDAPVLAIPDAAVQFVEGANSVFVPVDDEPNTFARRVVDVGKPVAGYVPVLSGLSDGDELVVANSFILKAELGKSEAGHSH